MSRFVIAFVTSFFVATVAGGVSSCSGTTGYSCYDNNTCNGDLICVRWDKDHSICADKDQLNVGGFTVPKACETGDMSCAPCEPGWKRGLVKP